MPKTNVLNTSKQEDLNSTLKTLVKSAQNNDTGAFGQIYDLFFTKIFRFIFFRTSHKETAEDLAEEVFLKAFKSIKTVNKNTSFEGWLYQIAKNLVIDHYRSKKIQLDISAFENILEYDKNIFDDLAASERQKQLFNLINHLTPEQQTVIKLKFLEELSNGEISALLGKSEGNVRIIQHRAITALKELRDKYEP